MLCDVTSHLKYLRADYFSQRMTTLSWRTASRLWSSEVRDKPGAS
ncbi:hypothetical protein MA5S0422_2722 [Mycobacteroides abscessus 5S-0422]|uniref:Uncharacterized protein n=1 Tax=Mycobacteroides abscessus subsp. bolletii 1513 TaxID=1299321 RepID=X8DT61_9MYCO|nr:hypothetical protein MA5S0304_1789 [Mycobacteroides abscessus 5S-0304]EIU12793.1 hypothetical protein MA5S0421_2042 [Mycobacteroides abscessus 5S-0421]EIU13567.1 hypothetical protein MA5S0422_2722 [Mycobacteroides abscessus 5S-0422]EIU21539.1 hypothetical protein MA5S0708_4808 [Mycobacteroides abscessus 5S-0708]EIU25847.1 hypothetical protein MA5S0817_5243 [Mycobacteroides abscessus 5S-0817]EIU31792.1 hypothetical protein MA5S1212_4630 [Mycobacteroides abscessus 5S-1212]EIU44440.1 hypothet